MKDLLKPYLNSIVKNIKKTTQKAKYSLKAQPEKWFPLQINQYYIKTYKSFYLHFLLLLSLITFHCTFNTSTSLK